MDIDDILEVAGWLALTLLFFACMIFGWVTVVEGVGWGIGHLIGLI